jgi:hypothetical protein
MKNFICLSFLFSVLFFSGCEKTTEESASNESQRKAVLQKAQQFSQRHDQLVQDMLSLDNAILLSKANGDLLSGAGDMVNHVIEVIYKVSGVKPVVADEHSVKIMSAVSGDDPDYFRVDLDAEQITLATYAVSEVSTRYLCVVDVITQNTELTVEEKVIQLQGITDEIVQDTQLTLPEMERLLTAIEVLKGSLELWSNHQQESPAIQQTNGMQKAMPFASWSFFKKLGFVAAADAVGGVLGFFLGGYIVVNGIPIYLPSGGTGMVLSAASLSYIAAKAVGW